MRDLNIVNTQQYFHIYTRNSVNDRGLELPVKYSGPHKRNILGAVAPSLPYIRRIDIHPHN